MKKILTILISLLLLFILAPNAFAESIQNYTTNITVKESGIIDVTEEIEYDFGLDQRHGIFREIPFTKTNLDGKKFELDITILGITDETGNTYKYDVSRQGEELVIKIGDPNKFVTGIKKYLINYTVGGAVTYFSDHDELYWNILGTDWDINVYNFESTITLPSAITSEQVTAVCYSGAFGYSEKDCTVEVVGNTVKVASTDVLSPGHGLTAAVSFPKGFVQVLEPKPYYLIHPVLLTILKILGSFVFLLLYILLPLKLFVNWYKERKYIKSRSKIVAAWFDPPKDTDGNFYTPIETALLIDPKINHKKLTATLVHLAQRGFIKIIYDQKDGIFGKDKVYLQKLKEFDQTLTSYEKQLLDALFATKLLSVKGLKALEENFPRIYKIIDLKIPDEARNRDYLTNEKIVNINDIKGSYTFYNKFLSIKKIVGSELVKKGDMTKDISKVEDNFGLFTFLSLITLNIPLFIVSLFFYRKTFGFTEKGIENYSFAQSLKNFIVTQDEQYDFQAERQLFFEKLLPYATAFGVEDVWIKRFPDLDLSKTSWYEGDSTSVFALDSMTRSLNTSFQSSTTSSRSSSGFSSGSSGGSSGGGGGGGGGGSW